MHTNHVVFVYQEHVIWVGAKHKGAAVQLAFKPPVQHHTSSRKATVLMNEYSSTCYRCTNLLNSWLPVKIGIWAMGSVKARSSMPANAACHLPTPTTKCRARRSSSHRNHNFPLPKCGAKKVKNGSGPTSTKCCARVGRSTSACVCRSRATNNAFTCPTVNCNTRGHRMSTTGC
jgi:hypothetical protein